MSLFRIVCKQQLREAVRNLHKRFWIVPGLMKKRYLQRGSFGGIDNNVDWRHANVRGIAPFKYAAANGREDRGLDQGVYFLINAKRQLSNLLDVLLQIVVRHGSILSIVPRSELERIEKRGLEVGG